MKQNRARVGVCGRNDHNWREVDFEALHIMKAEAVKLMSFTAPPVVERLFTEFDDLQVTVRLWTGSFGVESHPTPKGFVDDVKNAMAMFTSYGIKRFEVHNEPNHFQGIEGWYSNEFLEFDKWFIEVCDRIRQAFPGTELGFPGLAVPDPPHRDLEWVSWVSDEASPVEDWRGAHCYWQNPHPEDANHLTDYWGERYKSYFRNVPVEITEYGNSNTQGDYPVDWDRIATEYVQWHIGVFRHTEIVATHGFILSAPQKEWEGFAWVSESGEIREPVRALGAMVRPALFVEDVPPPDPPIVIDPPVPPPVVPKQKEWLEPSLGTGWFGVTRYAKNKRAGLIMNFSGSPWCWASMSQDGALRLRSTRSVHDDKNLEFDGENIMCFSGGSARKIWNYLTKISYW